MADGWPGTGGHFVVPGRLIAARRVVFHSNKINLMVSNLDGLAGCCVGNQQGKQRQHDHYPIEFLPPIGSGFHRFTPLLGLG
jgi:hypothetical protein